MTAAGPLARQRQLVARQVARALHAWPWTATLRTLALRFREDHLALTASSLTFTTLLSLVPLATVALALFTAFPMFASFQTALEQYLVKSLVPETIARPVLQAVTQFAGKASRLGTAGLVVLVATAIALMLTIDRTLNAIWRVTRPRPVAQRVLVYWAALTLGPLLVGASLTLTSYALSASRGWVGEMPGGIAAALWLLQTLLFAAAVAGLFRFVPNTAVRWRHAWAGAVFVVVALDAAKRLLAWYVGAMPAYSAVYGAFATVPILLLWVYVGWIIVLLGAVIAAYAPSLAMRVVRLPERPGQRFALALRLLGALERTRAETVVGLPLTALAERLRVDPLQLEPVIDALGEMGWCARLDEEGDPRHVLLVDPHRTSAGALVDRFLLEPDSEAAQAFRVRAGLADMTLADLL